MLVSNLVNENGNATSNQFVIVKGACTYFQSYNSIVCRIGKFGKVTLGRDWNYSNATSKYLYQFLRRHGHYVKGKKDVLKKLNSKEFAYDDKMC